MLTLSTILQTSHALLRALCGAGDVVLDATMGNGHDTVFLAELVGRDGLVIAVDKQAEAIAHTADLLDVMGLTDRVKIIHGPHAEMEDILAAALRSAQHVGGLAAAVLNLGYLPGGNKKIITEPASTLEAMNAIWPHIRPGGLLSVHTYSGHEGAQEETATVAGWMQAIDWREAQVTVCTQYNKPENPESLFLAVKAQS